MEARQGVDPGRGAPLGPAPTDDDGNLANQRSGSVVDCTNQDGGLGHRRFFFVSKNNGNNLHFEIKIS